MQDWLSYRARVSPERPALVSATRGETWEFAELDRAVDELAGRLATLGVGAGDHLGAVMETRVEYVRLAHAAMRLGAVLVPLGDRQTAHELAGQIETGDLTTLVCGAATEARAVEAAGNVPVVSMDTPEHGATALADVDVADVTPFDWDHTDTLWLLFTSGTTGDPKAVQLTLWNVLSSAVASTFRLGVLPTDRWLVALSLHHTGGLTPVIRGPLYGTTVVLRETFDAGATADDIDRYDVTGVSLVPTMLRRMLDERGTLADSLRVVLLGGAPAPRELLERCRDYAIPAHPTYGMTETASQIATATPQEAFDTLDTVGRPLLWTDLTVVGDDGDPLSAGETGELVVSGPTVTPGYYGDAAATVSAFCEYGLRTGDVGYRDEAGRVYVLNRRDDRIITGGENVDPGEVAAVVRDHPAVRDVAVVGVPDPEWGQRVAALVVPEDGAEVTAEAIDAHCRERLAGFKLPRRIQFAASLPRTVSGTVERDAVRERFVDGADSATAQATDVDRSDAPSEPTGE